MTICQVSDDVIFKLIHLTLPSNSVTNQLSVSYFGSLGLKHPPEDGLHWQNFLGEGKCLYITCDWTTVSSFHTLLKRHFPVQRSVSVDFQLIPNNNANRFNPVQLPNFLHLSKFIIELVGNNNLSR